MKKKGSHVGVMISFGVFMIALVFLYSILQPSLQLERDKDLIFDNLISGLVEIFGKDSTSYTSGSIRTSDGNFVGEIEDLATSYETGYTDLKTELGITSENDFGFIFTDTNEAEISPEMAIPSSVDVYVKEIPVYYTGGEENVLLGFLILEIWG